MAGVVPGNNGDTGTRSVETKRWLIQRQLVLLLHADECQRCQPITGVVCSVPHCRTITNVLTHLTTCNDRNSCQGEQFFWVFFKTDVYVGEIFSIRSKTPINQSLFWRNIYIVNNWEGMQEF